jgi:diacylglycerol O-acyltransferase / wax synthase
MDHLGGVDATFLYTETPETPMHVGSLNVYELPPGYKGDFVADVRKHLGGRLHLAPVFRRKLLDMPFELVNPVWVNDDDLDLEYHVRGAVLPKPGSREQLDKLVGRLHSSLLDRSRPLWEIYVIEGLQPPPGAPKGTRHVGFYTKVHHASLDGASGVAFAYAMTDVAPVPRQVRADRQRRHPSADAYGIAEMAWAGLRHMASQYLELLRSMPTMANSALALLQPTPAAANGEEGRDASNRWFAPRTPFNVNVTNQRSFASVSIPFAEVRQVAKANDVTINDVVLAICSGALRRYLAEADALPARPLQAAVPVSVREAGNVEMNTQAMMTRVGLASDVDDPIERLRAIHRSSDAAKTVMANVRSLPTDFPSLGAPWLVGGLAALYGRSHLADRLPPLANVTVSNVPGPTVPLYLAGAKMLNYYPVSIVTHGVALNITLESYNGSLDFGLVACRKAVPDLPDLAGMLVAAHRELLAKTTESAAVPAAPVGATARKLPRRNAAQATTTDGSRRRVVSKDGPRRRASALAA